MREQWDVDAGDGVINCLAHTGLPVAFAPGGGVLTERFERSAVSAPNRARPTLQRALEEDELAGRVIAVVMFRAADNRIEALKKKFRLRKSVSPEIVELAFYTSGIYIYEKTPLFGNDHVG